MLYLALSCFQGRLMSDAAETLLSLAPGRVGLQLTPGCAPDDFNLDCETRTHHGFTRHALRARVWNGGELRWEGDSLHPPLTRNVPDDWTPPDGVVLETMFPGYAALSSGAQLDEAMDAGLPVAVDVAHLQIQRFHDVLPDRTLKRLTEYPHVREIHVSASDRHRDSHDKLTDETWGVDWARERLADGLPIVLECYMHRLSTAEREDQVGRVLD